MEPSAYVATCELEGKLLVVAARSASLDAPVPPCPGWRQRDVLAHVGFVHRWATGYISNGWTEMVPEPDEPEMFGRAPGDAELVDWVEEGHAALVGALRSAPANLECWTFLPAPSPLSFWARRQAHETTVHRIDTQLASSLPVSAIEPAFGADGIDELLFGFFARRKARDGQVVPWDGTISLQATDYDASWAVRFGTPAPGVPIFEALSASNGSSGHIDVMPGVTVRAGAADLYQLLWNRRSADGLDLSGSPELLGLWRERARVTWS